MLLGKRSQQIKVKELSRFLSYILSRRPDEFGLVPDDDGNVSIKELLQAFQEEPGWRHVRKSHINELLMGDDRHLFESDGARIKALDPPAIRELETTSDKLPKILFTPVRQKAHPVVMEKGVNPPPERKIVLSPDKNMALRLGKRRDQKPVVLEVKAVSANLEGIPFFRFGGLFLCPQIPATFISGPQVSKELLEKKREAEKKPELTQQKTPDFSPGTFILDASKDPDRRRKEKGKKQKGWKEAARKERRRKNR